MTSDPSAAWHAFYVPVENSQKRALVFLDLKQRAKVERIRDWAIERRDPVAISALLFFLMKKEVVDGVIVTAQAVLEQTVKDFGVSADVLRKVPVGPVQKMMNDVGLCEA